MDAATEAKTAVEETQRESRRLREEGAQIHVPRFFVQNKEGRWVPKFMYVFLLHYYMPAYLIAPLSVPSDPVAAENAVQEWIWSPPPQSQSPPARASPPRP